MANKEIVLCKMFTGNYWENENNLGYETINMFLPDGQEKRIKSGEEPISYMYLPADGDYKLDEHEITDVLLVRSIPDTDGQTVQIIGKAEVFSQEGEVLRKWLSNNYKCLSGGREFNGLVKIFNAVNPRFQSGSGACPNNLKESDIESYCKSIDANFKTDEDYLKVFAVSLGIDNQNIEWTIEDVEKKTGMKVTDDDIKAYLKVERVTKKVRYEYACKKLNYKASLSLSKFKDKFIKAYEKAKVLQRVNNSQQQIKTITYGRVSYEDIFKNNASWSCLNIYYSLKVKNLVVPKKNIYITTDDDFKVGTDEVRFIIKPEKEDGAIKDLSGTKQTVYIKNDIQTVDEKKLLQELNNSTYWEYAPELDVKKFDIKNEVSFLTVLRKEYDELAYSNLFAYFYTVNKKFFKYFFESIKDERNKPVMNSTSIIKSCSSLNIEREKKNIDIFIETEDAVIVVENKIKSAINGKKHDIHGDIIQTQLEKYHDYVEENFVGKNHIYLIFAPNYNKFDSNEFVSQKAKEYKIIRYKELSRVCEAFKKDKGFDDFSPSDKGYFEEFIKALKKHEEDTDKNYFKDMQIRLKKLFG